MTTINFPAPTNGIDGRKPKYGMQTDSAFLLVNGICRYGAIVSRASVARTALTGVCKWLHRFASGSTTHLIAVNTESDAYRIDGTPSLIYNGSGTVTESNAVMFDGVLQYSLYPAAAPRTWDGYSDAALSITRPATGDWSDPVEKVTNGDFASGASWTTGSGWAIGAGVATATASSDSLSQTMTLSPGRSYTVTFTISGYTAGTITPRFIGGTTVTGTARSANGTYTETITAHSGGNTAFDLRAAAATCSVDNVSIKAQGNLVDADVTGFCVHKSRVWYWSRKSDEACYTALLARGGTLTRFPLGYVAETGGNIVLIETLTMDGGNGPDDFLAFILDTGEALIYQGSDPGSANDWSLVGRFRVPPPLNGKCVTRIGGDSLMLTQAGLIPLQNYIKAAFGQTQVDWLDKINAKLANLVPDGAESSARITDGRLYFATEQSLLLASVQITYPVDGTTVGHLFAMDTSSQSWSALSFPYTSTSDGAEEQTNHFVSGFARYGNETYMLQSEEFFFLSSTSARAVYPSSSAETGLTMSIGWGFQLAPSNAIANGAYVVVESEGVAATMSLSIVFDNDETVPQFASVNLSGSTYDYAAAGEGRSMSPRLSFASSELVMEGMVKFYSMQIDIKP